jgi:hypothetical protein
MQSTESLGSCKHGNESSISIKTGTSLTKRLLASQKGLYHVRSAIRISNSRVALIHNSLILINFIWNKEELLDQWKESIIVPIHKKGDKTDCSNYRGISMLSTSYKTLSYNLSSRLSPYIDEITGDHQCGF